MVLADELLLKVQANTGAAQAQMTKLAGVTNAASNSMVTSFAKIAMGAAKLTTGLVLAIGVGSVKAFANFDEAMTNSLAIMSNVSDDMRKQMEGVARDVAKTTTISAAEAAEAYFFLASAGMDAAQSMAALPVVAQFAQAGNFDMATATDLATDALSAMGLAGGTAEENLANLTRTTDVLIRANTLANATAEQFSQALVTKSAAAAKTLGISLEETTAVLAVMADQGIKGTLAGTQLAMTLNNLGANAVKNSDEFAKLGITIFDSAGEMLPMSDIVNNLTTGLAGMSDEQKIAAISALGFGDKAAGLVKTLLGTGDAIAEYQSELENASGFTEQVAAKQLESFKAQWDLLKSKFVDIGLTIGSVLVPKLVELFDAVSPFVDKMATWIEENDKLAVSIGTVLGAIFPLVKLIGFISGPALLVAAAIGGIWWAMDKLNISIADVIAVIQPLASYFGAVVSGGDPLNDFLTQLPEPIQDFVFAVGEMVASVREKFLEVYNFFVENWDEIKAAFQDGIEFVQQVWEDIWAFLEPFITKLVGFISEEVGELIAWFVENWPRIQEIVEKIMGILQQYWERIWGTISQFIGPIFDGILRTISGALDIIKGVIQTVMSVITGDWGAAWDGIKQAVSGAWDLINGAVDTGWAILQATWDTIISTLGLAWETFWGGLGEGISAIGDAVVGALKAVINGLLSALESGANMAVGALNKLVDAAAFLNPFGGAGISHIAKVELPRLAEGGIRTNGGPVKVGERGTEVVNLPAGASVTPLTGSNGGGGAMVNIERMVGGDPHATAQEIGWEFTKRGIA